jgi:HD-GYP domain-containing protein (c-di-GMP phosphodiesterase class II)
VAADFIDLKSPFMSGHSRRCAELSLDAASRLGFNEETSRTVWRAALVHEFGTTAIPNSIWDKPATLTRAEFDRVDLHPMITEQMLRRSSALAALNPVACAHHEKADGSGYHKRLRQDALDPCAAVLAAVDVYVGLTTERADRCAFTDEDALIRQDRRFDTRRSCSLGDAERSRSLRAESSRMKLVVAFVP